MALERCSRQREIGRVSEKDSAKVGMNNMFAILVVEVPELLVRYGRSPGAIP